MIDKDISLEEMQSLELELTKSFHALCENNNLTYFLGYGSCLGAVRHKGFIPWDDDMDVIMPIKDYKKLIELTADMIDSRYRLISMNTDSDYIYPFAKYVDTFTELDEFEMISKPIGVYLDIFPVYGLSNNSNKLKRDFQKLQFLEYMCICARKKKPLGKSFASTIVQVLLTPISKLIGIRRLNQLNLKIASKYNYDQSKMVAVLPPNYGRKECLEKDILSDRILVNFEDAEFYIPKKYDAYLKHIYGDYMKLPPKEKQIAHHHYHVKFLKNEKGDRIE